MRYCARVRRRRSAAAVDALDGLPARRPRDRGRLRARARAARSACAVDLVVGDLDSVDPADARRRRRRRRGRRAAPRRKDATDLELALDAAVDRGATRGASWSAARRPARPLPRQRAPARVARYSPTCSVDARVGDAYVIVVRERVELARHARRAVLAPARRRPRVGVRTDGLRFPLRRETLAPGSTRGVSNEFLGDRRASVSLDDGVLLAVAPRLPERPPDEAARRRSSLAARASRAPRCVAALAPPRRRRRAVDDDHARHPRLVRGVEVGAARVHEADRVSR